MISLNWVRLFPRALVNKREAILLPLLGGLSLTAVVILSVDRLNQLFLGLDFRGLL